MNLDRIEEIINLVKSNDVKNLNIKILKTKSNLILLKVLLQAVAGAPSVQAGENTNAQPSSSQAESQSSSDAKEIKSTMVGTFFLQDSKELTDPQIKVGDQVNEGDVIGYIEAMKVMNEVTSDVSGEVSEIVVEHGTNVEYDQVLVKVK